MHAPESGCRAARVRVWAVGRVVALRRRRSAAVGLPAWFSLSWFPSWHRSVTSHKVQARERVRESSHHPSRHVYRTAESGSCFRCHWPKPANDVYTVGMRASERAYEALRRDILNWDLPPGSVLAEVELSERLGVSRPPERVDVDKLVDAGLANDQRGRGHGGD